MLRNRRKPPARLGPREMGGHGRGREALRAEVRAQLGQRERTAGFGARPCSLSWRSGASRAGSGCSKGGTGAGDSERARMTRGPLLLLSLLPVLARAGPHGGSTLLWAEMASARLTPAEWNCGPGSGEEIRAGTARQRRDVGGGSALPPSGGVCVAQPASLACLSLESRYQRRSITLYYYYYY